MADTRMPLNTQGMRSTVKILLTGNAISDQTIKTVRRQQIPVCVMTAAITVFRRVPLFLEYIIAITQAKGFSDKSSMLISASFICSMGPLSHNLVSNFSARRRRKLDVGKMSIVERVKSLRKGKFRMTSGSIRETSGRF
jgi:hypothetical protein